MTELRKELKPVRLPEEVIETARRYNTALLSDAMRGSGAMNYKIKPIASNLNIIGTALTVNMRPGDNLFLHEAIYVGEEGYVIVADGKGHTDNAYLGELMAGAAKAIGLEGIIIDGLVRDKNELLKLDFPIYAKGFVPNGPYKDGPGDMNTTISCGGVTVNPGDLIVGDEDGVVVVPVEKVEEVFAKAEKKLQYEEKRNAVIAEYERNRNAGIDPGTIEPGWLREKMDKFGY